MLPLVVGKHSSDLLITRYWPNIMIKHVHLQCRSTKLHTTLGIIISGYAAGYVGEMWGWRSAFYIFGAVGVVHGIVMAMRLKDKKTVTNVQSEVTNAQPKVGFMEGFKVVFTTPTALILMLCFSGLIFVLTGYLTWMPTYLYERFDMDLASAGFHSMFYTHLFAFIGVLLA